MLYSVGDLDALDAFFKTVDFGKGIDIECNGASIEINQDYVDDRIRLLRLNVVGAKNEKYGLTWFEVLLHAKRQLTNDIQGT